MQLSCAPKFAVQPGAGNGIGGTCIFKMHKGSNIMPLPVKANFNDPSLRPIAPVDALGPRGVSPGQARIVGILRLSSGPKIAAPIVQPVAVPVVYVKTERVARDEAMHSNIAFFGAAAVMAVGVHSIRVRLQECGPIPLAHKRRVHRVDHRLISHCELHKSNVAFKTNGPYFSGSHDVILSRSVLVRAGQGVQPFRPEIIPHHQCNSNAKAAIRRDAME